MARKGLTGQLNMFDLFKSMEDIPMGEVQMVSLMPEDEPKVVEPEVVETPEVVEELQEVEVPVVIEEPKKPRTPRPVVVAKKVTSSGNDKPAMCRQYVIDGKQLEIAYINYNKVRITKEGQEPEVREFDTSKDAVDYYVQKMQELEPEEE